MYTEQPAFNVYSIKRIIYSLTDILPAVALASSVKLLKSNIISRQKEKALEKEKLASELNFLKAQTNPHFLFNTLNNLYGLARRNDKNTAPSIMKLSNLMRYILYECSAPTIPIENEVSIIEDYIQLEKLRYDDRLKVSFEKSVDNWKKEIAPLILLPFVENAFKHGASENRIDTIIDINLELIENSLKFSIRNTSDSDDSNLNEGIGMKNVKRQLDLIYGKNYVLDVFQEQGAFTVNLLIYPDQNVTK
jgi:sensor histidine kinase YesM